MQGQVDPKGKRTLRLDHYFTLILFINTKTTAFIENQIIVCKIETWTEQ